MIGWALLLAGVLLLALTLTGNIGPALDAWKGGPA